MEPVVLIPATERPDAATVRKDRRLRALNRRELQRSVWASGFIFAAGELATTVSVSLSTPRLAHVAIPFGLSMCGISLILARLAVRRGRRYVVPLGMMIGLITVFACVAGAILMPPLTNTVVATLGMIPLAFALFLRLGRRAHAIWLALALLLFFGWLFAFGQGSVLAGSLGALLTAAFCSAVVSLAANEVQTRRQLQMDKQILALRALYGRMREHETDLRRQDEFLLMQQETLVVQQAELLRLNEELETIARLDALTGLGNRLRLNEDLAQLAGRIERSGGTAGLLLLDLDRFKRLNDSCGHLAGDEALRGVAEVLRRTSRVGDGLYRYGGEEFLVLLHDCDETVLELAGQRYITAIYASGMAHPDNPPWGVVTASAGAAELSQRNCVDVDAALRAADEALYLAKGSGRNRVEVHAYRVLEPIVAIDQQRAAS